MNYYGTDLFVYNYITKKECFIDCVAFALLSNTFNWTSVEELILKNQIPYPTSLIYFRLSELITLKFIIIEDTKEAKLDYQFETRWVWGPTAGYYHFGIKDPDYMNPKETIDWLHNQVKLKPDIPLYQTNQEYKEIISLPKPKFDLETFCTMRKRRSYRGFEPTIPISQEDLQQCLFSGFGITGFIETPMKELALLPMKMAPSGGGRNPYEAYVYVRNVQGIPTGIYHYSGLDHSLGLIRNTSLPSVGKILAEQPWFDNAAVLVLLVANFERTMWKYPHPTGFRVVLLEAGHIAQNLLLSATALGLASAPTCAVNDSLIQELLGLDPITQSVIHTVSIGRKSTTPTDADIVKVISNPHYE